MARNSRRAGEEAGTTQPVDSGLAELRPDPGARGARPRAWTLLLDGAPQSHVDLDDPTRLVFSYQRHFGHVVDLAAPPGRPLTVLHLGGGGLTLPRYVAATRPRSRQQVAETDTALTELVRRELPWERTAQIRIRGADAREVLARSRPGSFDLVVADVYSGARVPAHCTTVEYLRLAEAALRPGGRYAANLADGGPLSFSRGQVATALAVFAHVCLLADPAVLRGRQYGNLVLLAGQEELPLAELSRRVRADGTSARVVHGRELAGFAAAAPLATDATAAPSPAPPAEVFDDL
jgi:spermidine synthase